MEMIFSILDGLLARTFEVPVLAGGQAGYFQIRSAVGQYMNTGGITMVPLVGCCLWMWVMIFYQLPFWQNRSDREIKDIRKRFSALKTDFHRHDKALLDVLRDRAVKKNIRQITTIKVLAATAPVLGLFGTVTGMIKTFESVARFGLANPKALAGGISEAMITTQFGLFIAVPGIFAVVFLKRVTAKKRAGIEKTTMGLLPEHKIP